MRIFGGKEQTSWLMIKVAVTGVVASVTGLVLSAVWSYMYSGEFKWNYVVKFGTWQVLVILLACVLISGIYSTICSLLDGWRFRHLVKKHHIDTTRHFNFTGTRLDQNGTAGSFAGHFSLNLRRSGLGYYFEIKNGNAVSVRSKDTTLLSIVEDGEDLIVRWEYAADDFEHQEYGYKGLTELKLHNGIPSLLKYYNDRPSAGWITFDN